MVRCMLAHAMAPGAPLLGASWAPCWRRGQEGLSPLRIIAESQADAKRGQSEKDPSADTGPQPQPMLRPAAGQEELLAHGHSPTLARQSFW